MELASAEVEAGGMAIEATIARSLTKGVARQFWLMNEKRRCSIPPPRIGAGNE
jgi:hypothetical protein